MPRPPRIQFPNACYHVINRGNYRSAVFASPRTKAAFETCLFEMCLRMDWVLCAYVVMRNHFHLAVRTPRANLAAGMQWLETTFATRFNRFRGEHGHLFQGRYHAPLVEPGEAFMRVMNYIHLNPVRARIVTAERLADFRYSSFHWFASRGRRKFMPRSECLRGLGLSDDPAGWRGYHAYLRWLAAEPSEQKRQEWSALSKGWAVGSPAWRQSLSETYRTRLGRHRFSREENSRLDQQGWGMALEAALQEVNKTIQEARNSAKGADWKLQLAHQLRRSTTATVPWLAQALHMGAPSGVRALMARNRNRKISGSAA